MTSRVALRIVGLAVTIGCSLPENWTGIVYPNRDSLQDSVSLGSFPSRLECAAAAIDVLGRMGAVARGDYECGLNCKRDESLPGFFVCKTTEKPIDLRRLSPGVRALRSLHERCMAQVASLHRPDFLTTPLQLKVRFGLGDPSEQSTYTAFAEAVDCLGATSRDPVPKLSMGPTSFAVYFDEHAKRLGLPYRLSQ